MNGLFVTATDTGVGKTIVAGGIAGALRRQGIRVGVYKPIQSGNLAEDKNGDAARLKYLSGVEDSLADICPYSVEEPLTPQLALQHAGRLVNLEDIAGKYRDLQEKYDSLIVEGAGGLAVPYTEDGMVADAARKFNLPLLIVSRPHLGTINHTVLTVEYARKQGLEVLGIVFSGIGKTLPNEAEQTNAEMIVRYGKVPFLGSLHWLGDHPSRGQVMSAVEESIDLQGIKKVLESRMGK